MKKKILLGTAFLFILLTTWQCKMILYGIDQARGQYRIIREARPIEEVLSDQEFPDTLKQKIRLTMKVRQFAIDSLGLHNTDNYTTLYDQKGKPVLWNLSASERHALKPYTWHFPFLGHMPYKGFFELDKALKEEQKLIKKGYDTRVRTVSGWSTLGILNDPLLSNMLDQKDGQLAELIIHELTHATIFVKNQVDFNENLASFIGEKGAATFLRSHFGDSSRQWIEYMESEEDSRNFKRHILAGTQALNHLYHSFNDSMNKDLKDSLKWAVIAEITGSLDTLSFHNERYYHIFEEKQPNNAFFMAQIRYHAQEDSLMNLYLEAGGLKAMIEDFKTTHGK